jgi:hypothetical protein
MTARRESEGLHQRVRAFVDAFERGESMPESFDSLAVDVTAFQAARVPGYARLCAARGVDPRSMARASEAPAVPAEAFKLAVVFAFAPDEASATFRTSGTSSGARGVHRLRDVGSYDAGALAFGRPMLLGDLGTSAREGIPVLVLGPPDTEAQDSSLAHMCALFAREFGPRDADPSSTFFVRDGALAVDALRGRVASLPPESPAMVLATSFALVHLLDALDGETLALPPRSRVMQTGGFKGRSREVSAEGLRRATAALFAVDERAIVAEYGMTELSSQFWEATLAQPDAGACHGVYREPPWARVVPVHPETLAPVADGGVGLARIEDLANVDSAFAVLTQDRVRRVGGGFELLGRTPGAPPRGCSIALDEMLSGQDALGSR